MGSHTTSKARKNHQPNRRFTMEFIHSLPMENLGFGPKSQLMRAEGPTICVNPICSFIHLLLCRWICINRTNYRTHCSLESTVYRKHYIQFAVSTRIITDVVVFTPLVWMHLTCFSTSDALGRTNHSCEKFHFQVVKA